MSKEPVDLSSEKLIHFAEHEILLEFTNDSGAEVFEDWWWSEGKGLFDKYCEEK